MREGVKTSRVKFTLPKGLGHQLGFLQYEVFEGLEGCEQIEHPQPRFYVK